MFSVALAIKVSAFCGLTVANTQCAERMTLRVIRLEHAQTSSKVIKSDETACAALGFVAPDQPE